MLEALFQGIIFALAKHASTKNKAVKRQICTIFFGHHCESSSFIRDPFLQVNEFFFSSLGSKSPLFEERLQQFVTTNCSLQIFFYLFPRDIKFRLDNQAYLGSFILHLLKTRWSSVDFKNLCKLRMMDKKTSGSFSLGILC